MAGLAAVTTSGLALAVVPSAASAATPGRAGNAASDLVALTAYSTYLSSLTAAAPSAAARAGQLVAGVDSTCPDGLADLAKLSAAQLQKSALTAFGREVDAALDLAYVSVGTPAVNRFAITLDALTWSSPAQSAVTANLIGAERGLATTAAPDLCTDATALDAAPLSEPTTTQRFLARYRRASSSLATALSAFQTLLADFETKAESRLVAQINALVSQYSSQSASVESADADSVLSDLGVSGQ